MRAAYSYAGHKLAHDATGSEEQTAGTHIYAQCSKAWQPVSGYSVERIGIVYCVYNTYGMGFTNLGLEVRAVLRCTYTR